ncbi:OpgC family protein [Methylomonas koyamae]|uniref:OpgC family protein n=1 Tax=Methylomonas koyamae TaxID=702114 RepID=UPI001127C7C3|nr:OpgC domain-containing protein [Methylomonas koyamae]TPQ26092.1 OpgC domain-containing protein [Methylomonas koyamae]
MKSTLATAQPRNRQLDFFRGVALLVIFVNHMPGNPWFWYTPSRFGFSDSAEIFVFLSGYVSAVAYGRGFRQAGLALGSVRVFLRCAQIYAAHLASFLAMAAVCVVGNRWLPGTDYIQQLNIAYFFNDTQQAVFDLFALSYVPNYFDILPLYLVLLAWVPLAWSLSLLGKYLAVAASLLIYLAAWHYGLELSGDPHDGRPWFFNPFCWQLLFFTGFAFAAGWLPQPGYRPGLILACALIAALAVPLAYEPFYSRHAPLLELRAQLEPLLDKSHLGPLRWLHLLALAYLAAQLPARITAGLERAPARWLAEMGRQSLPLFLCGMVLSYLGGMALDWAGREPLAAAAVNLAGIAGLLSIARLLAWLHAKPWQATYRSDAERETSSLPPLFGLGLKQAAALPVLVCAALTPLLLVRSQDDANTPAVATAPPAPEPAPTGELLQTGATKPDTDTETVAQRQL